MTFVSRVSRTTCLLAIGILVASSSCAAATQSRHRATTPPPAAKGGPAVTITGVVKDASNGLLVQNAVANYGDTTAPTNGIGQFVLSVPSGIPITITITHPAFLPFQKTITAQAGGGSFEFLLTGQPSITVKTTTGQTYTVDIGTARFAYALPLSAYVNSDSENFCKPDGSPFNPTKFEFRKITGPATQTDFTDCCDGGLMMANADFKSGLSTAVYFKDSCHFTEIDFGGRDKATGLIRYVKFTEVAEIDFP